jgi:DNA ligase (NAD+)
VRQIENIPKKINYKGKLEVRGEVVMLKSIFEQVNKEREFR